MATLFKKKIQFSDKWSVYTIEKSKHIPTHIHLKKSFISSQYRRAFH